MLAAHANDWTASFGLADSAGRFFVAQLHAWNASTDPTNVYYAGAVAPLRDAQLRAMENAPSAELVTAVDGGDPFAPATSIHPRGKQLVGRRLAAAILARRFDIDVPYSAPRYAGATAKNAGSTLVAYVNVTDGNGASPALTWVAPSENSNSSRCPTDLTIPAFMCSAFEVMLSGGAAYPDGTWVPATATLEGGGLVLSAPSPPAFTGSITGTRNGWNAWPVVNVYSNVNADGTLDNALPLLPWSAPC